MRWQKKSSSKVSVISADIFNMTHDDVIVGAPDYRRTLAHLLAVERLLRGAYFSAHLPM
jgi:hypothetical protein